MFPEPMFPGTYVPRTYVPRYFPRFTANFWMYSSRLIGIGIQSELFEKQFRFVGLQCGRALACAYVTVRMCACAWGGLAYVQVCMRACVRACGHARVRACVGEHACALQWAGSQVCVRACIYIQTVPASDVQTR